MRLFTPRNKAAVAVVAVAGISLTACSSDSSDDTASSTDQASTTRSLDAGQPASRALTDLIVDASLTPEGFEYLPPTASGEPSMADLLSELSELTDGTEGTEGIPEDPEGLLGGQPISEVSSTTPTQCTGLALDTLTVLDWMMLPTDTNATAGYGNLSNDDDAIMITLTSNPADPAHYPADLSQCAEFTRTMQDPGAQASSTFTASPSPVSIDNAEILTSANVTLTGAAMNDQPVDGEGVNTTVTMITATTGGITFTLVAPEATDPGLLTSIATAQAERINNAPAS